MTPVYIAIARALSEQLVVQDLRDVGFNAYAPMIRKWQHPDVGRRRKVEVAMLSRYVFVSTDDIERDFDAIRHARRVSGILGRDGKPRPLDAAELDWLGRILLSQCFGLLDFTGAKKPKFSIGQTVRILAGPFKGHTGTLTLITETDATVHVAGKHAKGDIPLKADQIGEPEKVRAA